MITSIKKYGQFKGILPVEFILYCTLCGDFMDKRRGEDGEYYYFCRGLPDPHCPNIKRKFKEPQFIIEAEEIR